MDSYIISLVIIGGIGVTLPYYIRVSERLPVSYPMLALLFGALIYMLPLPLPAPDPILHNDVLLLLTELAVIISLMGTGLKIDRYFSFSNYRIPLLLVSITMILCIAAVAAASWWLLGLVPATAILLGAVFAPTDPVIADEVQVEIEEKEDEEHPVRFSLTAEAGMNDSMAFPFTWLAILVLEQGFDGQALGLWAVYDVVYRLMAGVAVGYGLGRLVAWFLFVMPKHSKHGIVKMEFIAISATLLIYGLTEVIHGYGFMAVFVGGYTIRHFDLEHQFHLGMHAFITQVEQMFMAILLVLLGGYVWEHDFIYFGWKELGLILAFLFLIRPLSALIIFPGSGFSKKDRWIISFMGIKGIGSLFYLSFALHEVFFAEEVVLWEITAMLIVVSIILHGLTAHFLKRYAPESILSNQENSDT